jgi:hypothetical protein
LQRSTAPSKLGKLDWIKAPWPTEPRRRPAEPVTVAGSIAQESAAVHTWLLEKAESCWFSFPRLPTSAFLRRP